MTKEGLQRPVLWAGAALEAVLDLPEGSAPPVRGVSIDSRTLQPGDLFIALSGDDDPRYRGASGSGRDGHDFVTAARAAGAAAALVAHGHGENASFEAAAAAAAAPDDGFRALGVDDPFDALWTLARAARARTAAPVFAITGSSGKTTAKAMLTAALTAALGPPHAAEGSLNNHIGVPLSLARMPQDAVAAVFEIGMNSPGEIAPLAKLVHPQIALVLNVLPVHLEGLGSLEAIRREKLSIAVGLGEQGTLVVHDAVGLESVALPARVLRFGRADDADVRLLDGLEDQTASVRLLLPDGVTLDAGALADGPHRRLTACAVIAMLSAAGIDPAPALRALADAELPPGRGRILQAGGVALIDDSYNANPESVRQAIVGALEHPGGRRFALLGDMLELGAEAPALHAGLAEACGGLDAVFCVGPLARFLHDALPGTRRGGWWPDCTTLPLAEIAERLRPGDVLLVKASNRLFWKHGTVAALRSLLDAA